MSFFSRLFGRHPNPSRRRANDVYDERTQAKGVHARPGAQKAAAEIARAYHISGVSDPGYIANVIEAEVQRIEQDPHAPVSSKWSGKDPLTGMTYAEFEHALSQASIPAGMDPIIAKAAKATAARLARSYSTSIEQAADMSSGLDPIVDFLRVVPGRIAEHLSGGTTHARIAEVEDALREIQAHRRAIGMGPLDTHAAGWTERDILIEADRLRRHPNPMRDMKHRLL